MAYTVKDVPDGFWFKLDRNGAIYYKICKGKSGNHSLCVRFGEKLAWNMSNQSHVKLIKNKGKPKIKWIYHETNPKTLHRANA